MLSTEEDQYYKYLWTVLDPQNQGFANAKDTVQFFKRSQLPIDKLKTIWLMSVKNEQNKLFPQEFYVALRLISYCQNGYELNEQLLQQSTPTPLPVFDGIQLPQQQQPLQQIPQAINFQTEIKPQISNMNANMNTNMNAKMYDLPMDQYGKYEIYYKNQDKHGNGFIAGEDARTLFEKSQLPKQTLINLWALVDTDHKGYLYKNEFIIAIHLIALCRKDLPLPEILPDQLQQLLSCQETRKPSASLYMTQQPVSTTSTITTPSNSQHSELFGLNTQIQGLQTKLQNQVSQIQSSDGNQEELISEKKKNIEFLNSTIQKLEKYFDTLKQQELQYKEQLKQLTETQNQKMQQINQLQENISSQLNTNQALINQQQQQMQLLQQTNQNNQNNQNQNRAQSSGIVQPQQQIQPPISQKSEQYNQSYNNNNYLNQQQQFPQQSSQQSYQQQQQQPPQNQQITIDDGYDYSNYIQKIQQKVGSQNSTGMANNDVPW